MKTKTEQRTELLNEALGERGIVCLHFLDQGLVTDLCDIIGSLHRLAETKGCTAQQIADWVAAGV